MQNKRDKDLEKLYDILKRRNNINFRCNLLEYIAFFKEAFPNDKFVMKLYRKIMHSSFLHIYEIARNNYCILSEINQFENDNRDFFSLMIPISNLNYCNNEINFIEKEELERILLNFSKTISNEFYLFVKNIIGNNKIFIRNSLNYKIFNINKNISTGFGCIVSIEHGGYFIYLNNFQNIKDLCILVHEIGHLYYNCINKFTSFNFKKAKDIIKEEIPARTMEWLLIEYLEKYNKSFMNDAIISLNNTIISDENVKDEYTKMKYQLGDFASWIFKDYINKEITFDNFLRYIYNTDYREILENAKRGYNKILSKRI